MKFDDIKAAAIEVVSAQAIQEVPMDELEAIGGGGAALAPPPQDSRFANVGFGRSF